MSTPVLNLGLPEEEVKCLLCSTREDAVNTACAALIIVRILMTGFDEIFPPSDQEINMDNAALLPSQLRMEIDDMNNWVNETVNNGVYRFGFATSDEAYQEYAARLYSSPERLDKRFAEPFNQPHPSMDRDNEVVKRHSSERQ